MLHLQWPASGRERRGFKSLRLSWTGHKNRREELLNTETESQASEENCKEASRLMLAEKIAKQNDFIVTSAFI